MSAFQLKLGTKIRAFSANKISKTFEYEIKKLIALGFQSIDLDISGIWHKSVFEENLLSLKKVLDWIKDSGLYFNGVHFPFGGYMNISAFDFEFRQSSLELAKKVFKIIDEYQPACYIFHGSNEPIADENREEAMKNLVDSLNILKKSTPIKLCVEILPRTCILNTAAEALQLTRLVDGIYICVDTNHFLKEKTEDGILVLGDKIGTLHISDHDYCDERHWLPTQGSVEWMKVIGALEKVGYKGSFTYELTDNYAYEQMKENYDYLFATYNAGRRV